MQLLETLKDEQHDVGFMTKKFYFKFYSKIVSLNNPFRALALTP